MANNTGRRPSRRLSPEDLWEIELPSEPALAPRGKKIAYVVTTPDRQSDGYRSCIWLVPTRGGKGRRLTSGPSDTSPAWSPDGGQLAFVSAREDGPAQLYLLPTEGGEPRRLTELPLGAGEPVWSPEGRRIAFAALVSPTADRSEDGPIVIDRLGYKADGLGQLKGSRRQLFVVDIESGEVRQLTFGDRSASAPVWSPDGSLIAYACPLGEESDLAPNLVVHSVPTEGGRPRRLSPLEGLFQPTDWSPDGAFLLLAGRSELRPGHDLLYSLPAGGGDPVCLLPDLDRNVMVGAPGYPGARPRYSSDGETIYFCARRQGAVHLLSLPAAGGAPRLEIGGDRVVGGLSEGGGRLAFVAATPSTPGELFVRDGDEKALTDLFGSALGEVELFEPRAFELEAADGTPLHGWVLRPEGAGPGPTLLDIHGGPHNAWSPVFDGAHPYHQALAAAGWTVILLNPRGSDGYGESFYTGVTGGWGLSDEADFLAALDLAVAKGWSDPARLAVSGYSYGGYMTCWLSARHPDRFAAAVPGGCVSDLVAVAGTSDVGHNLAEVELAASVVGSRQALVEMSPITYVEAVRAPTLLLHGASDDRCPAGQAEEWFAALRSRGVPVELVLYPGASHLFILSGRPTHRIDYATRLTSFLERHVAGERGRTGRRQAAGDLSARLQELVRRHGVPGASVAVLAGGEVTAAAAGVLNTSTGARADPESIFQIGSITKAYTATVVMQLVDEGRLDLDGPLVEVLAELQLADDDVTKSVTMRHLLSHTSGIQGDHFPDTGRGDDCVARFVASCAELGQSHPLGATMSYCNTGYVIAGRVIEVLTGKSWDAALAERLFGPLGLSRTVTLPEEVLRHSGAVGHVGKPGQPASVAPVWGLPRSCGPAGLICSTASEVLSFGRLHLEGGRGPDGGQLLSAASVAAMQEPQVAVPDPYTLGSHWGLGWILFDWGGHRLFGHDGNTIGQSAFLRLLPEPQVGIALLTNGGNAQDLYRELFSGLFAELAGVELPARPTPPPEPLEAQLDLEAHVGLYERLGLRIEIALEEGHLVMTTTSTGPLATLSGEPTQRHDLVAVGQDLFVTRPVSTKTWVPVVFYRLADGSAYVHFGARATPKLA